jgi:hypothetical protein
LLHLAETEREILRNVPLQGAHLLLLFVPPLLVTLALFIAWRRQFGPTNSDSEKEQERQVGSDAAPGGAASD